MLEKGGAYGILVRTLEEGYHLGDIGDVRVILNWFSKKGVWEHRLDCAGSGWGQVASCCECGDEPPGSIKWGNFLTS
jgi:hypothetical protein